MTSIAPLCSHCQNFDVTWSRGPSCEAYPDAAEIPMSIIRGGPCKFHVEGESNYTPPPMDEKTEAKLAQLEKQTEAWPGPGPAGIKLLKAAKPRHLTKPARPKRRIK